MGFHFLYFILTAAGCGSFTGQILCGMIGYFQIRKECSKESKQKGIKVCVWINSYVGQESVLFDEGMEKGYFLKRANGDVWQWDMWQPGLAIVDFTNPQACRWYQEKLGKTVGYGCRLL